MAKFFVNGKWKKRSIAALSMALSLTFSLGIFTACGSPDNEDDDDDGTSSTEVDVQLLKNGNFEFYSEKDKELDEKRALINSPTSWSFSSGSPSSKTSSGIISVSEWDYLTKAGYNDGKGFPENGEGVDTAAVIAEVAAHWNDESVTAYDRLKFYDDFSKEIKDLSENSTEAKLFADYKYSIDYEDVEALREELGDKLLTHPTAEDEEESENLLMIHNSIEQYDVLGTAQHYTSSTTITLQAGTAAQVSVWVKTANLKHYYSGDDAVKVTKDAGAYIGVTHTVGGSTLDQMQIKNIITPEKPEDGTWENNGWQQYTIYIRANTFATSTFKLELGLGMGDSNNRFEAVDGYALFDDLSCTILPASEYDKDTLSSAGVECHLNSDKAAKIFDASRAYSGKTEFGLDLHADFDALNLGIGENDFGTTTETNGPTTYDSKNIVPDIRDGETGSVVGIFDYNSLETKAASNKYLKNVFANDFKNFPSQFSKDNIIMLLSTNGAAYTANVNSASVTGNSDNVFELEANDYMLVSFFVKTSKIRSGKLGASAILVDGENETTIAAFDSTTLSTVDIDETQTDIYDGWAQCFFFVKNETKEARKFTLKLTYGPTSIANSTIDDYDDGYAAFANFETMKLSKTQYGYASSSSSRAQTVSLTGKIGTDSKFDNNSTSFKDGQLATPTNFDGYLSGTKEVAGLDKPRTPNPDKIESMGIYSGLLNADPEYVSKYMNGTEKWNDLLNKIGGSGNDAATWWNAIFGDSNRKGYVANQPLVIMNTSSTEQPAYGYFAKATASVAANGTQQISMRVKVGGDATAYIYLTDTSDVKAGYKNQLAPVMPSVTYWYDDEGNILAGDPADKKKPDIAYYLEPNGLYTSADKSDKKYYANLANYEKDDDGNYVTSDGKTVFYYKEADGKYYAYYDKKTGEYSTEVNALPTDTSYSFVRYTAPADLNEKSACIKVENTGGNWVDVSFFIRAGSEAKNYRLEIWAGSRDCQIDNDYKITSTGKGIPAGGYVFFDDYSSSSAGDYDSMLQGYVDDVKDTLNKTNGKNPGQDGYLGKNDNLPDSYAYYYTFTFYDSPNYVRYDETVDEDWLGYDYTQSEQKEKLIWFNYVSDGSLTGMPAYAQFIDYSANDQSVSKETLKDDDTDSDTDEDTNNKDNTANILTIVSSVIFALAIVFAIGAVIVRKVMKKRGKSGSSKKQKPKQKKEPQLKVVKSEETPKAEEPEDENNPYNE